jgi:Domain of unknown function (DUF4265)
MSDRQNHANDAPKEDWVEVWFMIEKDADGYPESKSWEGLWSSPENRGFKVQSVPFYLKNVSRGDVVLAEQDGFLRFTQMVKHNGHNTYRLLMHEASLKQVKETMSALESRGLTVELNEAGILIAVDVPPSVPQQEIDSYLISNKEEGRWEMQDGYLNSIQVD